MSTYRGLLYAQLEEEVNHMAVACAYTGERQIEAQKTASGPRDKLNETNSNNTMKLMDARDLQIPAEREAHMRRLDGIEINYKQSLRDERFKFKYEMAGDRDNAANLMAKALHAGTDEQRKVKLQVGKVMAISQRCLRPSQWTSLLRDSANRERPSWPSCSRSMADLTPALLRGNPVQ